MSGRLGMTGDGYSRGDKLLGDVSKLQMRLKPLTTSQKVMWGGAATATAAGAAGTHRLRENKDRRGAAAAGAATGAAATKLGLDTSGYALREGLKHHEKRVDAGEVSHPLTRNQRRSIGREHRAKHGITTGTMHGAPMKAWRDYPTSLPGGTLSRVMGYKNTPIVAGSILAGGTLAGAARGGRKERVKKLEDKKVRRRVLGGIAGATAGTAAGLYTHHAGVNLHAARMLAQRGRPVAFHEYRSAMAPKLVIESAKDAPLHYGTPGAAGGVAGAAIGGRRRKVKKSAPLPRGTRIPRWEMQWRMNDTTPAPSARYKTPPLEVPGAYKFTSAEHQAKYPKVTPGKRKRTVLDKYLGRPGTGKLEFGKVETTMSDADAAKLARRYDTRGPLPKGLSREQKMKAYEGRYIASGGKEGEKWKHRADVAEVGRNVGLAGVTAASGAFMLARGKKTGPKIRRLKVIGPHLTKHKSEMAAAGSAVLGGSAELYGEHARSRRASYANSPAGVAGSALSRMQAYTPERKKS